jgi:hypothetical protein
LGEGGVVTELARLHPEDIEAIAERLAELQGEATAPPQSAAQDYESDPLLTAEEVGRLLGHTERYVWRLGREGALARVKPPGRKYVRFPLSGVLAYRESGYLATTAPGSSAGPSGFGLGRRAVRRL